MFKRSNQKTRSAISEYEHAFLCGIEIENDSPRGCSVNNCKGKPGHLATMIENRNDVVLFIDGVETLHSFEGRMRLKSNYKSAEYAVKRHEAANRKAILVNRAGRTAKERSELFQKALASL